MKEWALSDREQELSSASSSAEGGESEAVQDWMDVCQTAQPLSST